MLIDHIGLILFPNVIVLRIIGRLAFPIFAYSIFEGCKYTRNKLRYFLQISLLGLACLAVSTFYMKTVYANILITFSLSILIIYSVNNLKKAIAAQKGTAIALGALFCLLSVGGAYALCRLIVVDYGFLGVLVPVAAALFDFPVKEETSGSQPDYYRFLPLLGLGIALLFLSLDAGGIRIYCMLALIPLALSNGKRGKWNMKYFFYIFYPVHLLLLELIALLIK